MIEELQAISADNLSAAEELREKCLRIAEVFSVCGARSNLQYDMEYSFSRSTGKVWVLADHGSGYFFLDAPVNSSSGPTVDQIQKLATWMERPETMAAYMEAAKYAKKAIAGAAAQLEAMLKAAKGE